MRCSSDSLIPDILEHDRLPRQGRRRRQFAKLRHGRSSRRQKATAIQGARRFFHKPVYARDARPLQPHTPLPELAEPLAMLLTTLLSVHKHVSMQKIQILFPDPVMRRLRNTAEEWARLPACGQPHRQLRNCGEQHELTRASAGIGDLAWPTPPLSQSSPPAPSQKPMAFRTIESA